MVTKRPGAVILEDSDWSQRDKAISFRKLMRLAPHPTTPDIFHSTSAGYPPTETTRTYGVMFLPSQHGQRHTPSHTDFTVRRIRDGGIYCLRQVEAFQNSPAADNGKAPVFVMFVSFKRDERGKHKPGVKGQRENFQHQDLPRDWLQTEYGNVLAKKKKFEEWPVCQGMDGMWSEGAMAVEQWKRRGTAFPGLDMRKVDMTGYNPVPVLGGQADNGNAVRKWRLLTLYKIVLDDEIPSESVSSSRQRRRRPSNASEDILNLHACAHLYASDRNSLFLCQRALGFGNVKCQAGSLSHTVNFHTHASELLMIDLETGKPREYAQEAWTSGSAGDRVTHNSRIWDVSTGTIIASTVQDGMLRAFSNQTTSVVDGDLILRREAKL